MTGAQHLALAIRALRAAGVPDAPRDARRLLAHAMGIAPDRLTLMVQDELSSGAATRFDAMIARRTNREPVSHILGRRSFYGRDFIVSGDVLDPRPETEILIQEALRAPFDNVLDLGTGSGCILLTLLAEQPGATGLGVDLSEAALKVAQANAAQLHVQADFKPSDWFTNVTGQFDLIVSNPPYIAADEMSALSPELAHEPQMALTDQADGLTAYRAIAAGGRAHLRPGGRLLVEIGPTQAKAVCALFAKAGLETIHTHCDLDGRDRVVSAAAPLT